MPRSTTSSLFPDINVWIALTYRKHSHYTSARTWLDSIPEDLDLLFCRITQLGFLRLLTTSSVMGNEVLTQEEAWQAFDDWLTDGHASFADEPMSIEPAFRALARSRQAAPKDWADSYLSAFAQVSSFRLVTYDQLLARKTPGSLLLTV